MQKRPLSVGSLKLGHQPAKIQSPHYQPVQQSKDQIQESSLSIQLLQYGNRIDVQPVRNQTLLQAALEQHQPIEYKCQKGTCGKCRVQVISGLSLLSPANEVEEKKLNHTLTKGFRLACQARVKK